MRMSDQVAGVPVSTLLLAGVVAFVVVAGVSRLLRQGHSINRGLLAVAVVLPVCVLLFGSGVPTTLEGWRPVPAETASR